MVITALAGLGLLVWLYLSLAHGGFWRADQRLTPRPGARPTRWPTVVAVIPARDEEDSLEAVLKSHLASGYAGAFHIVLVDDHSTDRTGAIAQDLAAGAPDRLCVTTPPDLPQGWTGKLWAVQHGLERASMVAPDAKYVLLTDADIVHATDTLEKLVCKAQGEGRALVSLMARLDARGFWGGLLIPAFVYFFQKLYPFAWSNRPPDAPIHDPIERRLDVAAAAGGCMLVRADRLDALDGVAGLRDALIDDCTLARQIRGTPAKHAIWLGLADREVQSLRDNRRLGSIWTMVARTAYAQLGYAPWALAGALAGMALTYLAGPLAVLLWPWHGEEAAALLGGLAWIVMARTFVPTARLYGQSPWLGFALPLSAALYTTMTLDSALRHWRGQGGQWKGRTYPQPDPAGSNQSASP
ncbi:MAG: glycosyltransferase [Maricaulaceae bacterium]